MPSKVLTERMSISLTPEQKAAWKRARSKAGNDLSDNQQLHALLADYCASQGVDWPFVELHTSGKAKSKWKLGKNGKFTRS